MRGGQIVAIETLNSHVMAAKSFKNDLPNLWYVMARPTPWDDEEIPPAENMETTALDTPIGYKKFEQAQLIVPLNNVSGTTPLGNEIIYKGQQWQIVPDSEAFEKGARWVYLTVTIQLDDLPYSMFRQIGVIKGLQPNPSFIQYDSLAPNQVDDAGVLLAYDNRLSQRYTSDVKIQEDIVIKL